MEPVVLVSIIVLCVVFLAAMLLLLLLCRHKYYKKLDLLSLQHQQHAPEQVLVENMEGQTEHPSSGVELDQVRIQGKNIEEILENSEWVEDATGLAPHCLAILKTCHVLSERLVGMTMQGNATELASPETMTDLVATAKRISPRVDDVVRSLYPPLDPRLLEARCTALVLSVSHLVLITKNACRLSGVLDWIDQSLADVDDHLRVLREASVNFDEATPQQQHQLLHQPQQQQAAASSTHASATLDPRVFSPDFDSSTGLHDSRLSAVQLEPRRLSTQPESRMNTARSSAGDLNPSSPSPSSIQRVSLPFANDHTSDNSRQEPEAVV